MPEADDGLTADQRALDAFLVDNQELEELTARLSAFNLFSVLRIADAEIRHSNVLAWLLTPGESHGLGPTFLRRFLSRLLMENEQAAVSLSPASFELLDFSDVEVRREWQNIDILAHSKTDGWALLIENKIHSGEGKGQLLRYLDWVKREKEFHNHQIIPVYLTLEGDNPSDEAAEAGYLPVSHVQVLELAERIVDQNRSRIPNDARVLLDHYLSTLRRLTMQDQDLVNLCKNIYRKHRDAIDLIVEYGTASSVVEAIEAEIASLVDCAHVTPKTTIVYFLPKALAEVLPGTEKSTWPFKCWCYHARKENQLQMAFDLCQLPDPEERVRLVQAIQATGIKLTARALDPRTQSTTLGSAYQKLKIDEEGFPDLSDDAVRPIVASLWKKTWKNGEKIIDVVKGFDWS